MRRNNGLTGANQRPSGDDQNKENHESQTEIVCVYYFQLAAVLRLEAMGRPKFRSYDGPGQGGKGNGAITSANANPKSAGSGGSGVTSGAKSAASGGGGVTFGAVCQGGSNGFGGICTLTANSDGSFSTSSLFVFPDASGGLYGGALAAGDANGDGLPDTIAVTTYNGGANGSGTLTQMKNDGSNPQSVSFPACPNGVGASSVCIDASQTVTVTGQSRPGPNGSILFSQAASVLAILLSRLIAPSPVDIIHAS